MKLVVFNFFSQELFNFELPSGGKVNVNGSQYEKITIVTITPVTLDLNVSKPTWTELTLKFNKDDKSSVYLDYVRLNFTVGADQKSMYIILLIIHIC